MCFQWFIRYLRWIQSYYISHFRSLETISWYNDFFFFLGRKVTAVRQKWVKKIVTYFNPPKLLFSLHHKRAQLSKKEKKVLHHLVGGLSYKEIGLQMDCTINSVRGHIRGIYKKLQVNSRKSLIARYKDSILRNYQDL